MRPLTTDELIVTYRRFSSVIDHALDIRDRRAFARAAIGRLKVATALTQRIWSPAYCRCDGTLCAECKGSR